MSQKLVAPPPGGSSNQCLMKDTGSDGDVSWGNLIKRIEITPDSDLFAGVQKTFQISNLTDSSRIVGCYAMGINVGTSYKWWGIHCMIDQYSSSVIYLKTINSSDATIPKDKVKFIITYI